MHFKENPGTLFITSPVYNFQLFSHFLLFPPWPIDNCWLYRVWGQERYEATKCLMVAMVMMISSKYRARPGLPLPGLTSILLKFSSFVLDGTFLCSVRQLNKASKSNTRRGFSTRAKKKTTTDYSGMSAMACWQRQRQPWHSPRWHRAPQQDSSPGRTSDLSTPLLHVVCAVCILCPPW